MKTNWLILSLSLIILLNWQKAYGQDDYSDLSPREHVIANLLAIDKSSDKTKIAAKILYNENQPSTKILDIAAIRANEVFPTYADTSAWLFKAIGNSSRYRYLDFIEEKKSKTKKSKILKHASAAIKKIDTSKKEESFVAENYDFDSISIAIAETNTQTDFTEDHINKINHGDTVTAVYAKLGKPSAVSIWKGTKTIYVGYTWSKRKTIHTNNFQLIYRGSGFIDFDSSDGKYVVTRVVNVEPELETETLDESEIDDEADPTRNNTSRYDVYTYLNSTLIPADARESQKIARKLSSQRKYNQKYFDISAKKIWIERNTQDPYMTDAISHLARYIGNGKDSRYVSFLKKMIKETKNKKFKKHAKKALKSLPKNIEGIEQYTPPNNQLKPET